MGGVVKPLCWGLARAGWAWDAEAEGQAPAVATAAGPVGLTCPSLPSSVGGAQPSPPPPECECPVAAIASGHKLGGLKQQKCLFSQPGGPRPRILVSAGPCFP